MNLPAHPLLQALLTPLSLLYGATVRLRNRRHDRSGGALRVGIPVLSVGNLTVGGTGKTPIAGWLAAQLRQRGLRPAVVSRGYGGRAGKGPLVVSDGHGPRVEPSVSGDEPFLLAQTVPGALVIVGSDRVAAARAAVEHGARVIVLDDGFQHRRLARDLDIVLLDGDRPFGNRRLLPAGPLREPPDALRRADVVLITRGQPARLEALTREVRRYTPGAAVLHAALRPVGFVDARGRPAAPPRRAVAFCAIGNPRSFRGDLQSQGIELLGFHSFRDHHPYAETELEALLQEADRGAATLLTTEKDLARLSGRQERLVSRTVALRIAPRLDDPETLLRAVGHAVGDEAMRYDGPDEAGGGQACFS